MQVWHCYVGARDTDCLAWHRLRAGWTEANKARSPYPRGHDLCGYVEIPERGLKLQFVLEGAE